MFDHVESYENQNNTILNTKDKEIVKVDKQYLNEYVKKEHNLYNELKQIKMKFDDVIGLITHDKIYKTRTDEFFSEDEKIIANFFNQFTENEYLHINTTLCKFIRSGIHYPETYYKINRVNLNDYITFDKNKAYYSILEGEFYNKYGFPTAIHGVYYNIKNIDAQDILQKAGYSYIKNINYSKASENIKKYFFEINLLKNDNIYPNNYLIYCYNNLNIRFDIVYTAFSNDIKKIDNYQSLLEDKIYQRIFGMCDSISGITYMIHGDPEIINTLIHDENQKELYNIDQDIEVIGKYESKSDTAYLSRRKFNERCLSHITGYIIGYNTINLLEKLKDIPFQDILKIRVDSIMCKKEHSHKFKVSTDVLDWKIEKNKILPTFNSDEFFVTRHNYKIEKEYIELNDQHTMKKLNLITGEAGAGKTNRFLFKYGNKDNRLYDMLFCFPTHELKKYKQKETEELNIKMITYQKLLSKNIKWDHEITKYKNIIIDEASMISKGCIKKLIKYSQQNNVNLYFIGDLDNNRVYQLTPPEGELCQLKDYLEYDINHIHLDINYRQTDKKFYEKLKCIRNKNLSNDEIISLFHNRIMPKEELINMYEPTIEGSILTSVNVIKDDINYKIYQKNDKVVYKSLKTNNKMAKNERAITNKSCYKALRKTRPNSFNLAYAITMHSCQGLTYHDNIYIFLDRTEWTDNLLYVSLSRAKRENQIYLIQENEQEFKQSKEKHNIINKIVKYYRTDRDRNENDKCNLTYDIIKEMLNKCDYKCWNCKKTIKTENYFVYDPLQFSIDRISNEKGHIDTNVRISCFRCNSLHR